jgi:hypothetical protein
MEHMKITKQTEARQPQSLRVFCSFRLFRALLVDHQTSAAG